MTTMIAADPLEALYRMRSNLKHGDQYIYSDWTRCTVGHAYKGTYGKFSNTADRAQAGQVDELFPAVMSLLSEGAHALVGDPGGAAEFLQSNVAYVSGATVSVADEILDEDRRASRLRAAALRICEKAIELEEGRRKQAALDVIGQVESLMAHVPTVEATAEETEQAMDERRERLLDHEWTPEEWDALPDAPELVPATE